MPAPAHALSPENSPTTSDRALLRAFHAWGFGGEDRAWSKIAPAWRSHLRLSSEDHGEETPAEARESLLRDHEASARPDPARIHPSWFARALRGESPAVRGAVVEHVSPAIRHALGADETDPVADLPPDPHALGLALALWAERLVGDVPPRSDDPLPIVVLTRLCPRAQARLSRAAGQVKHAFAIRGNGPGPEEEAVARLTPIDRVRIGYFRRQIGVADPRLVPIAQADLDAAGGDPRRVHARLGLTTLGRLLAAVEPYRARWALQHIPYPVARLVRVGKAAKLPPRALLAWESWILEAAWSRLASEGRLAAETPVEPGGPA